MGTHNILRRLYIHVSDMIMHALHGQGRKAYDHFLHTHGPDELFDHRQVQLLRRHGSVHYFPGSGNYLVTGFSEADEIFRNNAEFRKMGLPGLDKYDMVRRAAPEVHAQVIGFIRDAIHKRYLMEDEPFLIQTVREVFDRYVQKRTFDFYNGFSKEVIFLASFRLFGFDHQRTLEFGRRYGYSLLSADFVPAAVSWMDASLRDPIVPGDGRMLNVLREQIAEGVVNHDQALDIGKLMLLGALKTSPILLTLLLQTLHADQRKWLMALTPEADVLRKFIEECIRTAPVIRKSAKEVLDDVSVGGCPMHKGSKVYLDISAANRDVQAFDEPENISLNGNRHRHLSFGVGMHQCPGMQVARHNALVILRTLLADFRSLHIEDAAWFTDVSDDKFIYQPSFMRVAHSGVTGTHQ